MNEVLNNIYTRRSIRKFKEQDVPKDLVDEIVKAGTYAPSGKNLTDIPILCNAECRFYQESSGCCSKGNGEPCLHIIRSKDNCTCCM